MRLPYINQILTMVGNRIHRARIHEYNTRSTSTHPCTMSQTQLDADSVDQVPSPPRLVRSPTPIPAPLKRARDTMDDSSTQRRKKNKPVQKPNYLYRGKQHFLTWPQTPFLDRAFVMQAIQDCAAARNTTVVTAFVGREFHKDGNTHFHAYVKTEHSVYIYPKDWDFKCEIETCDPEDPAVIVCHGNYQSVKDVQKVVEYVRKEDDEVLCFGKCDIDTVIRARKKRTAVAYEAVLARGALDSELIEQYPEMLPNLDKIARGLAIVRDIKSREQINIREPKSWYHWQKQILEVIQRPKSSQLSSLADREITWLVDPEGNCGKSFLARYLAAKFDAFYCTGGKKADIAHAYRNQPIVIFDFSRETEEQHGVYATIENLKNGQIFSGKYESEMKFFDQPLVFCFSNYVPDIEKFSIDRWGKGPYQLHKRGKNIEMLDSSRDRTSLKHLIDDADQQLLDDIVDEFSD
jgi:hypothetical protein